MYSRLPILQKLSIYLIVFACLLFNFCRDGFKLRFGDHSDVPIYRYTDSMFYFQEKNFTILPRTNPYMPMHSRIAYDKKGNPDILEVYLVKTSLDSLRHKQAVLTVSRVSSFGDVYYPKSCEDVTVKGKVFLKLKYELATRKGNSIFFFPTKDSLVRLY